MAYATSPSVTNSLCQLPKTSLPSTARDLTVQLFCFWALISGRYTCNHVFFYASSFYALGLGAWDLEMFQCIFCCYPLSSIFVLDDFVKGLWCAVIVRSELASVSPFQLFDMCPMEQLV